MLSLVLKMRKPILIKTVKNMSKLISLLCLSLSLTTLCLAQIAPPLTGYYWWTWNAGSSPLNISYPYICFSGWTQISQVLSACKNLKIPTNKPKIISFGGGNAAGRWSKSILTNIDAGIKNGQLAGWTGIMYDVGEGDSGLASAFATSFATAKAKGLQVIVTVSFAQPYNIPDAKFLMTNCFLTNTNIDYLSPQFYETGTETSNLYTLAVNGVPWSAFAKSRAKVVPSLVIGSRDYAPAVAEMKKHGVTLYGYLQWSQCRPLWYNLCKSDSECCSNYCDTNKGAWAHGVCKSR